MMERGLKLRDSKDDSTEDTFVPRANLQSNVRPDIESSNQLQADTL